MYYHFGPFELLWYLMANHCFQLLYIMQNARPGMAIDSDKETSYVVTTSKRDAIRVWMSDYPRNLPATTQTHLLHRHPSPVAGATYSSQSTISVVSPTIHSRVPLAELSERHNGHPKK